MFYQFNTVNKSFIEVGLALKHQGVANNIFPVQLHNERLDGIDPWDSSLSDETKAEILKECSVNFWYYIREVLRIPAQGGGTVPFKLDRGNLAVFYNTLNSISTWRTQLRQTYSTTSVMALLSWPLLFRTNINELLFMRDSKDSKLVLYDKFLDIIEMGTPSYIHHTIRKENLQREFSVHNKLSNSRLVSVGCPPSKEHAINVGRGLSSNIIVFDDAETLPNISTIFNNMQPAFSATCDKCPDEINAQIFNSPHGAVGTESAKFAMSLIKKMLPWSDKMYDISPTELKHILNLLEVPIIYIFHTHNQLGRTDEWFTNLSNILGYPDIIDRELLGFWS